MNHLNRLILITMLLANVVSSSAQNEFATIPLDSELGEVNEIMQFSDEQGNILFKFQSKDWCQFSLLKRDSIVANKIVGFKGKYDFLECLYDESYFNLLYRKKRDRSIHVYSTGKQSLSPQLLKTNLQKSKEKHLADFYSEGEFLVFNYSKSPFVLHTYRYEGDQHFEKKSQFFQNNKRERIFIGQIRTEDEMIFVRRTFKPFTLHFYRYFNDRGFEKKSVDIRALYKKAGFEHKVFPSDAILDTSSELPAFIQKNHIYLDMEMLVHVNPNFFKPKRKKFYAGLLHLDWDSEDGEILSFDKEEEFNFKNRSVALLDSTYFKLLVNRDSLELSIFGVSNQSLLKKYAYNKDQEIDLIHEEATLNKRTTIYLDLFSSLSIPIEVDNLKDEVIDTKKLLKNLSAEDLRMDVFSDDKIIELDVIGIDEKRTFFDRTFTASFASYLSKSDFSIIEKLPESEDPGWMKVDEYISNLMITNKNLGEFIAYRYQDKIHIAYIDKKQKHCKIITY